MRRVFESDRCRHPGTRGIGQIDQRDRVGCRVQNPGSCWLAAGKGLQSDALRDGPDIDTSEDGSGRRVDGKQLVRPGGGCHERRVIVADLNRERSGQRHAGFRVVRRQRFEINESRRLRNIALETDTRDPVEKGSILQFRQAMFLAARAPIDFVSSVSLSNEDAALRIDRQAIQQRTERVDRLDECVGLGIEHVQVSIRDFRMLDDVDDVPQRQHIVVGDRMIPRIECYEIAIDLVFSTAGKLCLIVRFERKDVQTAVSYDHRSGVLCGDIQSLLDLTCSDINNGNLVLGRERDISFFIGGEGNPDGFVKSCRFGGRIKILDRGRHLKTGRAGWIDVDHTHRIRDVIGNPNLFAIRPDGNSDRVYADVDSNDNLIRFRIDNIDGIGWRVRHIHATTAQRDRGCMGTHERRMSDCRRWGRFLFRGDGIALCLLPILSEAEAEKKPTSNRGGHQSRNSDHASVLPLSPCLVSKGTGFLVQSPRRAIKT